MCGAAAAAGSAVMICQWHRPSDVIAAVLVLGFAGAGVLGLLLSRWAAAARMLATGAAGFLAIVAAVASTDATNSLNLHGQ